MIWHSIWQMRTTLDFDDDLMDALMARHPGLSKTEAIERTLRSWLQDAASRRLRDLGGTLDLEDRSAELRAADRAG
ncbi:MAG: type II toxin-antitoxin system VapB family antitoxin [Candidatus Dormiibacterota bacterium]